jgi:hypothetical protein
MNRFLHSTLFAAAAVALVAIAPAQKKGAPPPELTFEKVWNDGPQSFADLAGKVVILDFAQTW